MNFDFEEHESSDKYRYEDSTGRKISREEKESGGTHRPSEHHISYDDNFEEIQQPAQTQNENADMLQREHDAIEDRPDAQLSHEPIDKGNRSNSCFQ